jgi:cytochrome c biogenesis protein CcdA
MIFRFSFELATGIITILALIIFGKQGQAAFALLALLPVILRIKKYKPDERELALFYKAGNFSLLLIMASFFGLGFAGISDFFYNNWMFIAASALLIAHGIAGIIIFRIN